MIQKMRMGSVLLALVLAGCGGGDAESKGPDNASSSSTHCAPGTILEDGECVPVGGTPNQGTPPENASDSTSGGGGGGSTASTTKVPYDKDNVDMKLRGAAARVKANCGAATDENGKAPGPWGQTKVTITLGRNGRVHDVTIPSPYDGTPPGRCVLLAFKGLIFPPYAAPADVSVDWDVEIVQPSGKKK
jgi:hypothetical protein